MCERCRAHARELYALIGLRPERDPQQPTSTKKIRPGKREREMLRREMQQKGKTPAMQVQESGAA